MRGGVAVELSCSVRCVHARGGVYGSLCAVRVCCAWLPYMMWCIGLGMHPWERGGLVWCTCSYAPLVVCSDAWCALVCAYACTTTVLYSGSGFGVEDLAASHVLCRHSTQRSPWCRVLALQFSQYAMHSASCSSSTRSGSVLRASSALTLLRSVRTSVMSALMSGSLPRTTGGCFLDHALKSASVSGWPL